MDPYLKSIVCQLQELAQSWLGHVLETAKEACKKHCDPHILIRFQRSLAGIRDWSPSLKKRFCKCVTRDHVFLRQQIEEYRNRVTMKQFGVEPDEPFCMREFIHAMCCRVADLAYDHPRLFDDYSISVAEIAQNRLTWNIYLEECITNFLGSVSPPKPVTPREPSPPAAKLRPARGAGRPPLPPSARPRDPPQPPVPEQMRPFECSVISFTPIRWDRPGSPHKEKDNTANQSSNEC